MAIIELSEVVRQDVPDKLYHAAVDSYLRYGLKKITLEDIAQSAGVSRSTIYRHLGGKPDIVQLIAMRELTRLMDEIFGLLKPEDSLRQWIDIAFADGLAVLRASPVIQKALNDEKESLATLVIQPDQHPTIIELTVAKLTPLLAGHKEAAALAIAPEIAATIIIRMLASMVLISETDQDQFRAGWASGAAFAFLLSAFTGSAWAQEPVTEPVSDAEEDTALQLDEIVVTAQKRAEDVQDVPFSVTAIGGETFRNANIQGITELTIHLPNATLAVSPSFSTIYVRGIGTGLNDGFETSVGLYVDGVYMTRPSYLNDALIDIERVELLRGPQGTLYGKNTVAGALNITTGTPQHEWLAQLDLLGGEKGAKRLNGMINIPVIEDIFALRVSFQDHRMYGAIHNEVRGVDELSIDKTNIRVKGKWDITPEAFLMISADYATVFDDGPGFELTRATDQTLAIFRIFDERVEGVANRRSQMDAPAISDRTTKGINGTLEFPVWNHTLTFVAGHNQFDERLLFDADISPAPIFQWDNDDYFEQTTAEFRITSEPGKFEYVVGLYYYGSTYVANTIFSQWKTDHTTDFATGLVLPPATEAALGDALTGLVGGTLQGDAVAQLVLGDTLFGTFDQDTVTYSVFGQATWTIFEDLDIIGGLRGNWEEKTALLTSDYEKTGAVLRAAFGNEEYVVNETRKENNVAPKLSARYRLTEDINLYATVARGFKAGGFNPTAPSVDKTRFDQELSWTYEGGIKSTLWNRRLTLNLGYFYTDFEDMQISVLTGAGQGFFVDNAAEAVSKGVEWETRAILWEGNMTTFSGAWLSAFYGDFQNGPCRQDQGDGLCDMSGRRLARAPEWEISTTFTQMIPISNTGINFVFGFDSNYQSEHWTDMDLDDATKQDAYIVVNARAGIADEDFRWALGVNVKNATDELIIGGVTDVPAQAGSYFGIMVDRAAKAANDGYPPYNIEQIGEDRLRITLAVAGFTRDDLEISVEDNQLVVKGRQADDKDRVYLHRGIAARQFQKAFVLAEGIEVTGADLADGMLMIDRPMTALNRFMVQQFGPRSFERMEWSTRVIILLILSSILIITLDSEPSLHARFGPEFHLAEEIFGILFISEYVIRVIYCGFESRFSGIKGRLRFVVQPEMLIDLVAITPYLLSGFGAEEWLLLRTLRLFHLVRLIRFFMIGETVGILWRALVGTRDQMLFMAAFAALAIFIGGVLMYLVEGHVQPEVFGSIPRALWWSVVTVTTVGYGDVVPLTVGGKIIASVIALFGVAIVALPAGVFAAALTEALPGWELVQRFKLTIEYDGQPFVGWQSQPDSHGQGVQDALEDAIEAVCQERIRSFAAGRTDTGVHATGQVAHFDCPKSFTTDKIRDALNAHLRPLPVAVVTAEEVDEDFHARFSATHRHYRYRILTRRAPPALRFGQVWHVPYPLDAVAMDDAAQRLVGQHDFTTFRSVHCQSKSPVKTLDRLAVTQEGDEIVVEASARSFLHNQVRSLVGTLERVGAGRWTAQDVEDALQACDRSRCGPVAPPDGLTLTKVDYN
ncbi:truA [Symbiodinium microadriaticum]|nr:truA [Symbiodinium microadriaticum]